MPTSAAILHVSTTGDIVNFPWLTSHAAEILRPYSKNDQIGKNKNTVDDSYFKKTLKLI